MKAMVSSNAIFALEVGFRLGVGLGLGLELELELELDSDLDLRFGLLLFGGKMSWDFEWCKITSIEV